MRINIISLTISYIQLYSTVALSDSAGTVVERYEYNAYGKPAIYNAAFSQSYPSSRYGNNRLFTGREVESIFRGSKYI